MNSSVWSATKVATISVMGTVVIAGVAAAAWSFGSVDHLAEGEHQTTIVVDCDFDKFRRIMVRKKATAAMVNQGGMKLLNEEIHDMQIDTSQDDRPLLNTIRVKSKSGVVAIKQITVSLRDPAIDASELVLRQQADIGPNSMSVITKSKSPAGNLEHYETTLDAIPKGNETEVRLTVGLKVRVEVPKMFKDRADSEVQQSAEDAANEQSESIRSFIALHADKHSILPELGQD